MKSRMTTLRLELYATCLASRILQTMIGDLNIPPSNCCIWSDSFIVLYRINSENPAGIVLVDNYISSIHEMTPKVS